MFVDMMDNPLGPPRVWLKNDSAPGLAMSRSMGDKVGKMCGVTNQPEITEKVLSPEDKALIIASDGVWEFISSAQAVELIVPFWQNGDAEGACEKLANEATGRWERADASIDDITCIVIFLNAPAE